MTMPNYKRPNFDGDWWEKVSEYLKENPEEGFGEDQVKQFIKYAVNKYMNSENTVMTEQELKRIIEKASK